MRVHPDVLTQFLTARLDEPGEPRGKRTLVQHAAVEDFQPRTAEPCVTGQIAPVFRNQRLRLLEGSRRANAGCEQHRHVLQGPPVCRNDAVASEVHDQFASRDRYTVAHLLQPDMLLAQRVRARPAHWPNISPIGQAERLAVEIRKSERTGFGSCARSSRQQEAIAVPGCECHQTILGGA